ncbi:MAG: D-alanyl-D-alanine carboxypeptidase family protein [Bacillota bacterium]|nr:D-alanyl-D-alanine carboxypeptidase family protein [Bacillota bacterium]
MKKILVLALILSLFANFRIMAVDLAPSAKAAAIIDCQDGRILYEKNGDKRLPMASTTKIVTAITAIENGKLSDVVTVSANAAKTEGSSVYLVMGEKLTLEDLLYALLLESGNDASVAIAEHISGSTQNFAVLMNQTAKKAGATNSNFTNPSGLDDKNHYTTAKDLAIITAYALKNKEFSNIVSTQRKTIPCQYTSWDRQLDNHNKLLKMYSGADGVKTGYTRRSGRCLVSSATRNNWKIAAVTLSDPDDWNDHIKMMDYAFSNAIDKKIVNKEDRLGQIQVLESKSNSVAFHAAEDYCIKCLPDEAEFSTEIVVPGNLQAPVKKNDEVGVLQISNKGKIIKTIKLLASQSAELLDYKQKYWDGFKLILAALLNLAR